MPDRTPLSDRVQIRAVTPAVEGGRFPAKTVVGDTLPLAADVFRDGHERVAAIARVTSPQHRRRDLRMRPWHDARWGTHLQVDQPGPWTFQIIAWTDHYATWLEALTIKHRTEHPDTALMCEEGARLLERRQVPDDAGRRLLTEAIAVLRAPGTEVAMPQRIAAAGSPRLTGVLDAHPEQTDTSRSSTYPLWADRERGRFGAWYEFFPRSEGATWPDDEDEVARSGTLRCAAARLPAIADMGFDVVYLPPVHPIGHTKRKGHEGPHDLHPTPRSPGVPWAIGDAHGGHDAIHPDLGTLEDFDMFVAAAERLGMEVAMDFAVQCSPDHPWVTDHPDWFHHRADGSIACAENPPKVYQDIYPLDFDTDDLDGLQAELLRIMRFWIARGIRIFRVDNPHTKPLPFWEWLLGEVRRDDPDVIFLAEAFTTPVMMHALARLGFTQSYTYFAWRNTKDELTGYLDELAHPDAAAYFRPSFWPNTPDILTSYLQHGGRPAFKIRLLLAALLSPSYGIYAGYELCERTPLTPGSEEYAASEKYRYRPRDWEAPDSLAPYIRRINDIRRAHRAFRRLTNLRWHGVDNDAIIAFSKQGDDGAVLTIVNLDPQHAHEATTRLDLGALGVDAERPFEAHDRLTDTTFIWQGAHNYVRLDPAVEPAHVLQIRQPNPTGDIRAS